MPVCRPRALRSSLFPTIRMRRPARLGLMRRNPCGQYLTPGASTGAKRVRQLALADAQCSRHCPRLFFSCPASRVALEPAVAWANGSLVSSLRVSCSKLVPRMHWPSPMIRIHSNRFDGGAGREDG